MSVFLGLSRFRIVRRLNDYIEEALHDRKAAFYSPLRSCTTQSHGFPDSYLRVVEENPERVPKDIQKPDMAKHYSHLIINSDQDSFPLVLETRKTLASLAPLREILRQTLVDTKDLMYVLSYCS